MASLKAVQKGQTTITVTSKITKKVIARWAISVKSVGNGDDYRGDFENGESDSSNINLLPYPKLPLISEFQPVAVR